MKFDLEKKRLRRTGSRREVVKASELIVKCLVNEGVGYVFGIPGEENLDVMDALVGSSIQFVTTRHEQGAAFMADVYGRLTGEAGVCLATLGPGATKLLTGVADANLDRAPLVALTGQASSDRMHKESHQCVDVVFAIPASNQVEHKPAHSGGNPRGHSQSLQSGPNGKAWRHAD